MSPSHRDHRPADDDYRRPRLTGQHAKAKTGVGGLVPSYEAEELAVDD